MSSDPLLFGRDVELEALARASAAHRVVSVTGAPGAGKSALALAHAHARAAATLCSLANAASAEATCRAIADALGIAVSPIATARAIAEQIARALGRPATGVLVLDDADDAADALVELVPKWLREAPRARFIVTSRGRLRVHGVQRFDVGPIALPEVPEAPNRAADLDAVERAPAVRLFVRAARAVAPSYRLRAATAPVVAEIVRRLEGNPLAIELCASRVVVLGERELLELLSRRLDVLDGGPGALAGRSLRRAFTISWDRLDRNDAHFLAACSSFRSSFNLGAAAAVAVGNKMQDARISAAATLDRLEEASLVRAFEPDSLPGARRYALSASLRAFAAEKLAASDGANAKGAADIAARHAVHFGSLATGAQRPPLAVLALARDDLDQALAWALARPRKKDAPKASRELAARLLLAIAPLALARGPLAPFTKRVDQVLETPGLPRALSAELHLTRALALIFHGKRDDALVVLAESRRAARAAKAPRVELLATSKTGLIIGLKGGFREARRHFDHARSLLAALDGDPWLGGIVAKDRANVLSEEGLDDEAIATLAEARDLFHGAGDAREEGFVLMMLGSRLLDGGQLEGGRRDCEAALVLLRQVGDHRSESWTQLLLSLIDAEEGDLGRARTRLEGAIASFRAIGDAHTEGLALVYLGNAALEQGAITDAEIAYRDARARLAAAGDRGAEATSIAGSALVELARGRLPAARAAFATARERLAKGGRVARVEAVAILATACGGPTPTVTTQPATEEIRFARRIVARLGRGGTTTNEASRDDGTSAGIVVASDGSWIRNVDGTVTRIARAGAVRSILQRLAAERIRRPGTPLGQAALVLAGWPDETILPAAARNRLHVVIARLRKSGLERILVRDGDGYALDPAVPARLAEAGERP